MIERNSFKILAIDGGGIRGVFPAHILKSTQKHFNINFLDYFDMVAGTSTGAIIASAVATNVELEKIVNF